MNWFKYAAPQRFYPLAGTLVPWFGGVAVVLALALFLSPWAAAVARRIAVE